MALPAPCSDEHLRDTHQTRNALTHATAHTGQGRPPVEIPRAASGVVPFGRLPRGGATHHPVYAGRKSDADLRQQLGQRPARDQRHDDEEEDLERVPAHVRVDLAQEAAYAVDEPRSGPGARRMVAAGRATAGEGGEEGGCGARVRRARGVVYFSGGTATAVPYAVVPEAHCGGGGVCVRYALWPNVGS